MLAVNDARARLVDGQDWLEPLVRLRPSLGGDADGILRHDWWPAQQRVTALAAVVVAIVYAV
jgi:hypothetical protein